MNPQKSASQCLSVIAVAITTALFNLSVWAQSTDAEFRALVKERKFAEGESLSRERIAKNPQDDIALWHLARITSGDAKKRDELIPKVEQCIATLPQSARCQDAAGTLYGSAAMSAGMINGIKYASKIKASFEKAVELDPKLFDARRNLNQFYMQAPGIAGGSVRKAFANADSFAKFNPGLGALLRAEVHIYEKEFDKAEALLGSIKAGGDEQVTDSLSGAWTSLGFSMISNEQSGKAVSLFERLLALDMNNATLHFGLGRAQLEQKMVDAAIVSMERALKIDNKFTAHYRLGIAYQTKGDKPKAIAALKQFLTYQSQGKAADDAKKRIEEMSKVG